MARVFLCHASEDKVQIREVYHQLKALGFVPWLDEMDILPGQDWDYEIERALETSDFVLVFLSTRSVEKVGYVQREFRRALYHAEELPEGVIHTIPVKLDDCSVPRRFSRHQWVNLSENGAFDRIVRALHYGLQQRGQPLPEPFMYDATPAQSETAPPPNLQSPPRTSRSEGSATQDIAGESLLTNSGAEGRSVADAAGHPPQEPEPATKSPPKNQRVPAQKSRRVSVVTIGSLVIAAVSALAAVLVIPEARQWLGLDKPSAQRETSTPVSPPAQRETSTPVSPPREIITRIGMQFVRIPAGEFQMGANLLVNNERPVHPVRISAPFYMGKYEVTQAQWEAVMGTNPSVFKGHPNRPVENVSWEDVQEFITRLNSQEGWEVCRLPTEAQWEYAAQAGTTTMYDEQAVGPIAWYDGNSRGETHEVGQKRSNAWGVYDMLGNVSEWCHDGRREYTADAAVDPMGPTGAGVDRVVRGGSWFSPVPTVRVAYRVWDPPSHRNGVLGFRCANAGPGR